MPDSSDFSIQSNYSPKGDQPKAIEGLVKSIKANNQYQTLLGATGTGKSLGYDDPVFVVQRQGDRNQSKVVPIGPLIDELLNDHAESICQQNDTEVLDSSIPADEFYAQSFNPETGKVDLYKIRSFIRHDAPAQMYRLETACGRSASLTGDHNLWVLRDGQLKLIKTTEALTSDYVPLPEQLLNSGSLESLDSTEILKEYAPYIDASEALLAYANDHGKGELQDAAEQSGIAPSVWRGKMFAMQQQDQGKAEQQLPEFWPQLSKRSLGYLLQAYFDGDGTVESWSAVTATTASQKLASDLAYALMSLGIWARISKKWKRATNSEHSGNWYYQVSLSGQENLEKFAQFIGFSIDYKQAALAKQRQYQAHSNVDVVAIDGAQLRSLRQSLNLSAKALGQLSGISRSAIQCFELEQRRPRRIVLKRILKALKETAKTTSAQASTTATAQWWQSWKAMEQLTHLRWSAIASLTPIDYPHPYVYDFCVPGAETFLGGAGGFFVHNTFTMANVIKETGKPTLVLAHNKTLAAQLCNELRSFFPDNAVEYFISYYDYYQPEAYIPVSDTYIAKTSSINEEIDMLRHSATRSLFERKDVIVVASISCIYGLGIPSEYLKASVRFKLGDELEMRKVIRDLVNIQYSRNDLDVDRGRFRIKGDVLEIGPAYEDRLIRIEFFGDEIDAIRYIDPVTGEILQSMNSINVYPARHFVTPKERLEKAIKDIKVELEQQLAFLQGEGKLVEAQRLEQRTKYDLEMLQEVGYCQGVENYSRHLAGRLPGAPPECLLDYFPHDDWLLLVDESHVTVPQLRGMYNGDQARKKVLIDHGFRLPSAADNRPLKSDEFWAKVNNCVFVSATPGEWELEQSDAEFVEDAKATKSTTKAATKSKVKANVKSKSKTETKSKTTAKRKKKAKAAKKRYKRGTGRVVEQVIRPTGVIDPEVIVRPTEGQVDDLLGEIVARSIKNERVLVTTLTKRMAEDLTDYLYERGVKVRYMHSEINSIERIEIIRDLREGTFDVLIGVNLLREGLDLPEVSLVAILDADKEGFLRAERSLIQTIGRAARHIEGKAILYADNMTDSMLAAISETERRREIQTAYNEEHGIVPQPITKRADNSILAFLEVSRRLNAQELEVACEQMDEIPLTDIPELITQLEAEMKKAASELEFERAGELRDRIKNLRNKLVGKA